MSVARLSARLTRHGVVVNGAAYGRQSIVAFAGNRVGTWLCLISEAWRVIDDVYGYNAAENSGDPMDDLGHGTHVAGTVLGDGSASRNGAEPG